MKRLVPFALHQLSNVASGIGNGVVLIVIPWLVLDRTGSAVATGTVAAMSVLPVIFISPLIGVVIDHLGRRQVSIGADILSAVSVLLFPIVDAVGDLTFSVILVLAVLGAVFDPAGYTARKALIPDSARAASINLNTANGVHEGLFAAGWVVGPALGAVLISTIGPVRALNVSGAMFGVAASSIAFMRVIDSGQVARGTSSHHESFLQSMVNGLRVLRRDRALFTMTIMVMFLSAAYMPIETIVLPVHFKSIGDASGLGFTLSAMAAGMMLGAFSFGWIAKKMTRYHLIIAIVIGVSVGVIPMSMAPNTAVMVVAAFFFGAAWGPFNPLWNTLVQVRIPADAQGRVYGIQMSLLYASAPIGQLITVFALPVLRDLDNDRVTTGVQL